MEMYEPFSLRGRGRAGEVAGEGGPVPDAVREEDREERPPRQHKRPLPGCDARACITFCPKRQTSSTKH